MHKRGVGFSVSKTNFNAIFRQRLLALFFVVGFFATTLIPTVSAYAASTYNPDVSNPNISDSKNESKKGKENPNKAMKQNYPGGMQSTTADEKASLDAKSISGTQTDEFTRKSAQSGEALQGDEQKTKITPHELVDKRTATSSFEVNADGSITEERHFSPVHFQKDGKWENIDTSLVEDKNAGDSGNAVGRAWGSVKSWFSGENTYKVKGNSWQARFAPGDAKQGLLRIGEGDSQVGFMAVGAKEGVSPVITNNDDHTQVVHYYDLWPGVNVEYMVESDAVKENIVLKDKNAANQVSFKVVGADLEKKVDSQKVGNFQVSTEGYTLKGALNNEFSLAPANLILNNYGQVTEKSAFSQTVSGDTVTLSVDKDYLQKLPDNAFPAVIDPTAFNSSFGNRNGGNYVSFKSDGYVCGSTVCNPYAGRLYDSNNVLRDWRSAIYAPYDQFKNTSNNLISAKLHLQQRSNESFWTGDWGHNHTYYAGHATCLNSYNCVNTSALWGSATFGSSGDIDLTSFYSDRITANDFGAWVMLLGDTTDHSFKNFDPGTGPNTGSYVKFTYGGPPPAPSFSSPVQDQVYVDPQASFKVGSVDNPNGSTPLQYQMRVSGGPGGTGFLVASNVQASTQWTIPDNILQDGSTYYIQARSYDPITSAYSDWGQSIAFHIDMRTGEDKSQTYDTLGPVNVDLATGNLSTSASSHSSAAVGGNLGVTLNYNSPLRSRNGLVARYWNVATSYSGNMPTTTPNLTRIDQNVDFDWASGSPGSGINTTWFYAAWDGYFVAPTTDTYYFGGNNDDTLKVTVDSQSLYSNGGCYTGVCYGTSTISLTAGQVVPIHIEYKQATGPDYAHVYVKNSTYENIPLNDWLQTGVRAVNQNNHGLKGSYFARLDGTNTFSSSNYKVMERVDPYLGFDWGSGSPVPNGPTDFLVRWSGYITVPTAGTYTFGSRSDDGSKIMVGTSSTVALSDWTNHSVPSTPTWGGTNITLAANTPTPVTIEYYDQGGAASYEFWIKSSGAGVADQIVPSDWLSPQAQIVPDGWNLGVDGSGTGNYTYLIPSQKSAILTDSSGGTHEYTWNDNGGYKPPVNENGHLVRNVDGTFTLQDADGQTYVFDQDGKVLSVTSSVDDRNPAALQYEYASLSGGPVHLYKIKDGVDTSRSLTLYYSGQTECGSAPSGFDTNAPAGMLCAAKTNDGRTTYFYYIQGQLARVTEPGSQITDVQYESVTNSGGATIGYRMTAIRDALANDAIAAGVRTNNDNVKTQIAYDILGRVTSVTQPAATSSSSRTQHTIEYLPGAKAYVDGNGSPVPGYAGMTKRHITGATEPNGYTQRIKYDNLYRTIETTDIAGLSSTTEWNDSKDLVYSTTDPTGLKSTTVYDDEDRPVSSYGPAPKAWFNTGTPNGQTPLSTYASQIPRSDTAYDEGIVGPAVSWFDYTKLSGNSTGALTGAPKLHTTGINSTPGTLSNSFSSPPITASSGAQGIGFSATGMLRLSNGTYTISADTSDGIRVWVDDQLKLDQWVDASSRTVTGTSFTISDSAPKRIQIDVYRRTSSTGTLNVKIAQSGGFSATTDWSSYLKPDYSLTTSTKVYDSTVGDTTVTANYGSNPELGLPQSSSVDPTGLNLTSTGTYETQGATGSLLRSTSNSRAGDSSTNAAKSYTYYGATETRDNPCTTSVTESYKQAGMVKLVTNASPDGGTTAGSTTETIYDDAGRAVATRNNSDSWTCTTYDDRGRVTQTAIPAYGSASARTVTTNYALWGDPTITGTEDASGSVATQIDLLGRTIYYHDAQWNETWTGYDGFGNIASRTSEIGVESYIYDDYDRLTQQKLDGVVYATPTYDQYGRVQSVTYPNASNQKLVMTRDALGRLVGQTSYAGGSQTPGTNLITNPSVEQASGSDPTKPADWQSSSWGTNTAAFTYLNEGYTGDHSVKAEMTAYTSGDAKWYFDPVAVSGSTTYSFKDYYKSNTATETVVQYTHSNSTVTYESLGTVSSNSNWTQNTKSFTTPSDATQVTVFHIISSVGWLIMDDAELYQTSSGSQVASDAVTRSQTGRVASGTENGQSKSYTYDAAGRLTAATIGSNTYSYGYGTQNSSCVSGTNANSGKNSNRTTQTINGVTTTYCYDYDDRLVSSSDSVANNAQYDSHGNMTSIGSNSSPLYLTYDSSGRNTSLQQNTSSGNGVGSYYGRDVSNRISYRETDTIASWNWTVGSQLWYGFISSGSSPSFARNANWDITEKYLSLAGGVLLTIHPAQTGNANKTYSLPNIHGDTMATTDASGTLIDTFRYDPFGNKISTNVPDNTSPGGTYGWVGAYKKLTEATLTLTPVQMGARVYLPTLGRFTQKDPILGGTANDYVYAFDPINSSDLTGMAIVATWTVPAGWCLQSCATISIIQPAAVVTQQQLNRGGTIKVTTIYRPTVLVVTPRPTPKRVNNLPDIKYGFVVVSDPLRLGPASARAVDNPSILSRTLRATDSGSSYGKVGGLAAGSVGCVVGSVVPAAGTITGCSAGWTAGFVVGFGIGFYYGWIGSEKADSFDSGPWSFDKPF